MATAVLMPKLGNTVESSIIVNWKKKKGDPVAERDVLAEVETDKAMVEVESPASGTLLELFFHEGDDVPVLTASAAIGEPGEDAESLRPAGASSAAAEAPRAAEAASPTEGATLHGNGGPSAAGSGVIDREAGISPRAKNLAARKGLDPAGIAGSGPGGRIIERDIQAALTQRQTLTPLAKSMLASGDFVAPEHGSGAGGRVTSKDLRAAPAEPEPRQPAAPAEDDVQVIPVKGTRRLIAGRMLASMQTTAQLTMNASADARALLEYRKRLKNSPEKLELQGVTINDLVLFVVSRTLPQFPEVNALFENDAITLYRNVHLGFAVDAPRGLIVPVIRGANALSLKQISRQAGRLAGACLDGTISPDELSGATFTVTNLGSLGVESFTPILNPPQVGILGVGSVNLKPVEVAGAVQFIPHIGLSLTINHQVVDGAPGARFLQAVSKNVAEFELLLAL